MHVEENNNNLVLTEVDSFDITEILECGQCFRFEKIDEKKYIIVAYKKELCIEQTKDKICFLNTTRQEFDDVWLDYFDLKRDYSKIKSVLVTNDKILEEAINFESGIRILNQDFFECLISFIISQNNRIPMIKQVIKNMSEKYGEKINSNFAFPDINKLINTTEEELKLCKMGFRAKYILDAVSKVNSKEIDFNKFAGFSTEKLRELLITINGVGPKVSDCVMLFSCKRSDTFPIDVWIKRVMQYFYFNNEETNIKTVQKYASDNFGQYAGFAQQYLFYYAREQKIGAKK